MDSFCKSLSDFAFALASQKGEIIPVSVKAQRRKHSLSVYPTEDQEQLFVGKFALHSKPGTFLGDCCFDLSSHTVHSVVCVS